jgi:lipid A 3-O-deacylase
MRAFLIAMALLAHGASADDAEQAPGLLSFQLENDLFAGFDDQYTNGSVLTWTAPDNDLPLWGRAVRDAFTGVIDAPVWRVGYSLSQLMFTPADITIPDPPADDRPYAGLLGVSAQISADSGQRLDTLALDVGVTGPPSLAEATQKFIHNDIGIGDPPRGWDTQLGTEVAFRLFYEQKRRYGTRLGEGWGSLSGLEVEALPQVAVAAGTLDISAAATLGLRLGEGLAMDWGVPRVRRSVMPSLAPATPGGATRWNVFVEGSVRVVGRDLFLDGNTFRDSRSTDKEFVVGEVSIGAAWDFGPAVLSYAHVLRTPDFEALDTWPQFGSLTLRVPF